MLSVWHQSPDTWAMPPLPDARTTSRHDMVMGQLMEAAERLFARQGFAATSLGELAAAVGLTRTGIYHYIRSKDDLLENLVRGFTLDTARDLERLVAAADAPALDRLRDGVTAIATKVATHPRRFLLMLHNEAAFSESLERQYRQARRRIIAAVSTLVEQGIAAGTFRPVDARLAAQSVVGSVTWASSWYPMDDGDGALPPQQMAVRLTDIALAGLVAPRPVATGGIDELFGHLREDLSRLQHMIEVRGKP